MQRLAQISPIAQGLPLTGALFALFDWRYAALEDEVEVVADKSVFVV